MRNATRLLITVALAVGGATMAIGQSTAGGPAAPVPGSGDSAKISSGNRENNAEYNRLIGAGDDRTKKDDRAQARKGAVPATAADIKAGASLRDIKGVPIGSIASVDANQAVVDTGKTKIGVPLVAFGKDDKGLLLGMTADKFNQLVAQAHAKSQGSN
jgi:hypothetical protein